MENAKPSPVRVQADVIRRQLLGDAEVDKAAATTYAGPVMREFMKLANDVVFDGIWARPGLDLKTRALVCVISDAATGRTSILPTHLKMALRQGWTQIELTESLLQLIGYVGSPLAREALLCAEKVFAEDQAQTADSATGR